MNRRSFMRTLAGAVAGFTVLPPATTYERVWRASRRIVNPAYYFDPLLDAGEWHWVDFMTHDGRIVKAACVMHPRIAEMPIDGAPFPHGAGEPQFGELRTINDVTGAPRRVVRQVAVSVPTSGVPVPPGEPA